MARTKPRHGWLAATWSAEHECPPVYRKRIAAQVGDGVAEHLAGIITRWNVEATLLDGPTPAEVRVALEKVEGCLGRLSEALTHLDDRSEQTLALHLVERGEDPGRLDDLRQALHALRGYPAAAAAAVQSSKGRPRGDATRRKAFAAEVLDALHAAGIPVRPDGSTPKAVEALWTALDAVELLPSQWASSIQAERAERLRDLIRAWMA